MKKYKILVEGENLTITSKGKLQKHGFFTTRFVEAINSTDAEKRILLLVQEDLQEIISNNPSDPPVITVDKIVEIDGFENNEIPGSGFTWYEHT